MAERKAALIGLGAVTPLGMDLETTYQALAEGQRAIRNERAWLVHNITNMGAGRYVGRRRNGTIEPRYKNNFTSHLAGVIHDFDFLSNPTLAERIRAKDVDRFYSTAAQFFIWAAVEAGLQANIFDENLMIPTSQRERSAVVVGTGAGGAAEIPRYSMMMTRGERLPSTSMPKSQPDNPMVAASIVFKTQGPNSVQVKACASGNSAYAQAVRLIENNEADIVIAGGVEALNTTVLAEFEKTDAASESEDPKDAPWPFRHLEADKDEGGAVLSEGAGVGLFVPVELAQAMGAEILAIVSGYSETSDASDWTMLSGEGTVRSMQQALGRAGVSNELDLLFLAHSTAAGRGRTKRVGDAVEIRAIHEVFSGKKGAFRPEQIAGRVIALKERLGHAVGGAKGIDLALGVLMMLRGKLLPSELDGVMDEADGLVPTAHQGKNLDVQGLVSPGMGFGGSNVTIVAEKYAA